MTSLHEQLREHFPEKVRSVQEQVGGQVMVLVNAPDAVDLARYLLIECATRLVTVFAEDRLNEESLFYIYSIFDRRDDSSWLILKARIPADNPSFPSLAAEFPAVNWQEREIQDWFGL